MISRLSDRMSDNNFESSKTMLITDLKVTFLFEMCQIIDKFFMSNDTVQFMKSIRGKVVLLVVFFLHCTLSWKFKIANINIEWNERNTAKFDICVELTSE